MKHASIAIAAALATVAAGQTAPAQTAPEQRLAAVYTALSANQNVSLTIVGNLIDNSSSPPKLTPIGVQLYYSASTDASGRPIVQLNLTQYTAGSKIFEVVADGQTLWSYRAVSRPTPQTPYLGTYSAIGYGTAAPAAQNTNYAHDLLSALRQVSPSSGPVSYATRMISELFAYSTGSVYRIWLASPTPPVEIDSPTPYQDPLTGLYADPSSGSELTIPPSVVTTPTSYVAYNGSPKRAIAFEIVTNQTTNLDVLNRIYYTGVDTVAGHPITTFWTLTPGTDVSLANFTPYTGTQLRGWRSVVGSVAIHG